MQIRKLRAQKYIRNVYRVTEPLVQLGFSPTTPHIIVCFSPHYIKLVPTQVCWAIHSLHQPNCVILDAGIQK